MKIYYWGLEIHKEMSTQEHELSWENTLVIRLEFLNTEWMNAYILYQWKCWSDGQVVSCMVHSKWYGLKGEKYSNQLALSYWTTVRLKLLSSLGLSSCLCMWELSKWVSILITTPSIPGLLLLQGKGNKSQDADWKYLWWSILKPF